MGYGVSFNVLQNCLQKKFLYIRSAYFNMENTKDGLGIDAIVVIPKEINADSDRVHKVIRILDDKYFGCPACCSGNDILWKTEESFEIIKNNIPKGTRVFSVSKDHEVNEMNV